MKEVESDMLGKSPLLWLDEMENRCEVHMREKFAREIDLLERQISVISWYVNEIGKLKRGSGLTMGELQESRDENLLRSTVPAFLVFQALDNLQAARLNTLHGYLSAANSCLRNVAEALRWANAATESAEVAREWLRNANYKKPKGFVSVPPVQAVMRLFDSLSKTGSHPLAAARAYAAWAKPEARMFLNDTAHTQGIRSFLNLTNQVSANFLFFLIGQFNQVLQNNPLLLEEVGKLAKELDTIFGIKLVREKST